MYMYFVSSLHASQIAVTDVFLYLLQTQGVIAAEQDGQLTINQDWYLETW